MGRERSQLPQLVSPFETVNVPPGLPIRWTFMASGPALNKLNRLK
jgi:hypothetical protein